MKRAFTIIELIFVIIILGILAAIAIPKLNASRNQAQISKGLSNIKIAINDINSYMLANESLASISMMSNVASLENADLKNLNNNTMEVKYKLGNDEDCLSFVFVDRASALLFGLGFNNNSKALLENLAQAKDALNKSPDDASLQGALSTAKNALYNQSFVNNQKSKLCQGLLNNESFQNLARKAYFLGMN